VNTETQKSTSVREYLVAAKHRRWKLLGAFGAGITATFLLAFLLPPYYRSSGMILIEQQEMPQDLVRSTVTSFADERVQMISKRVMTTETLLGIVRRYNLYPKQRAAETREALIKRMQKDIELKMISADVIDPRSGRPTSATIAFEVAYTSRSSELAQKVANELTTLYLNENLNNRTQLARDATTFLDAEAARLNKRIGELEAQLANFKARNFRQLPELTQLNMTLLDRTEEELRSLEARQSSLEQQRVFLEAQLVQLRPNSAVFSDTGERILSTADRLKMLKSALASAKARYGPDHPDIANLEREVAGLEKDPSSSAAQSTTPESSTNNDLHRNLERAQSELAQARERYTPEHPDRLRLEREVAELKSQVAAAPEVALPATADDGRPVPKKDADNPAYVQIQAQVSATIDDLKAVNEQIGKLRAKSETYQRDLSLAPQVEQQYRELSRDYDNTRLKYQEVSAKQLVASTAQNLEADRKGERFTLIDPPLPPEEPTSPNRLLIFLAGFVLSVGLAFGTLWLAENMDTSVRGRLDLLNLTGVPPLALVPHISTEADRLAMRWRARFALATGMATLCVGAVLAHFFYQPLDVLWFSFTHRVGF
jgi:uncharacterized protein involved in exopolysaccharide biosynthesis